MSRFDGSDYIPARDDERLGNQLDRVLALMLDGRARTLAEIATATGAPPASVSAQLRHLRKAKHGAWQVEKSYYGEGLYRYWVRAPVPSGQQELGL